MIYKWRNHGTVVNRLWGRPTLLQQCINDSCRRLKMKLKQKLKLYRPDHWFKKNQSHFLSIPKTFGKIFCELMRQKWNNLKSYASFCIWCKTSMAFKRNNSAQINMEVVVWWDCFFTTAMDLLKPPQLKTNTDFAYTLVIFVWEQNLFDDLNYINGTKEQKQ